VRLPTSPRTLAAFLVGRSARHAAIGLPAALTSLWWAPTLHALGGAQAPFESPQPLESTRASVDVAAKLVRAIEASDQSQAAAQLALLALGPALTPELVEIFASGMLPCANGPRPLSSEEQAAILTTLEQSGPQRVVAQVRRLASDSDPVPRRIALLRVLGAAGREGDLALATTLAAPAEHLGELGDDLAHAFRCGVSRILRRQGAPTQVLKSVALGSGPVLRNSLVSALGGLRDREGFEALSGLLGWNSALSERVLEGLAAIARDLLEPPTEESVEAVRMQLEANTERTVALAIEVLGYLEDARAATRITDHLEHAEPAVSAAARGALVRISGSDFGRNHPRWRAWVASEEAWNEQQYPLVLQKLRTTATPPALVHALTVEISAHTLYRNERAQDLLPLLESPEPRVRSMICHALRQLGSKRAVPALRSLLEDEEEGVQQAAWSALRAITGLQLPMEPEAWARAYPE
jgi:HEAT repeats